MRVLRESTLGGCRRALAVVVASAALFASSRARAADEENKGDPAFSFSERTKVKKSTLIATGNVGLLVTSGNSNVTTFTAGAFVSWRNPKNRFTFDGSGAYARQHTLVAEDITGDGQIQAEEIRSESSAGAQNWYLKPRYDRFVSDADSFYVAASLASDIPAGKKLTGGGQLGYSRILYQTEPHEIVGELGYDFTHERYLEPEGASLNVHSARAFLSHKLKLADDVFLQTSAEVLTNVLAEQTPNGDVGRFKDVRVNWRNILSAKVWKNISGRFSLTARYDNWPAPRPAFDLPYADGVVVPADKLDTLTELAIVVNFL
jgi:hypothetical protein